MSAFNPNDLESLTDCIYALLQMQDEALSEFELMRLVDGPLRELGLPDTRGDAHALFQWHFVLYHALYRLRDELWIKRQGHLEIGPLAIRLHPYQAGADALTSPDPLRAYYLDLDQLAETRPADVDAMLTGFYERMLRNERRSEALAALGLADPVDEAVIRRRYRELAMQHHPDRGGSTEHLQTINQALRVLIP